MKGGRATRAYLFEGAAVACAFNQHPHMRGVWMRTDPSVVLVACEQCKAPRFEPCTSGGRVVTYTHLTRRRAVVQGDLNAKVLVVGLRGQLMDAAAGRRASKRR